MKIHSLATLFVLAIACAAGAAHAVTLNPKGLGQVLIFPYYTVNKSQDTLLSVINTGDRGSAIKMRFKEGMNGREVMNLNLYLSPHDVWTARVSQMADDGGAAVFTSDHSCTYPPIGVAGFAFRASAYAGGSAFPADGGPTSVARTREGYVELIEMGEIIPGSALDDETIHVQHGTPNSGAPHCDPAIVGNVFGEFIAAPVGALSGSAAIVNVGEGTFFPYAPNALSGFTQQIVLTDLGPELSQANSSDSTYPTGAIAHVVADNGDMLALDYANGIDAVSAVFMADAIDNEFLTAPGLGANTDWVVTLPTKAFYVDKFYNPTTVVPPFHELFHAPGASNVEVGKPVQEIHDQEEGYLTQSDDFLPNVPPPLQLPWQVNVISFLSAANASDNARSGVFGSTLRSNIPPFGDAGWLHLDLASGDTIGHSMRPAANDYVLHGLPVAGFMVYNIINANAAPGKLANYGGSYAHRSTISCTQGATNPNGCP